MTKPETKTNNFVNKFVTSSFYLPTVVIISLIFYASGADLAGMMVLSAMFAVALVFSSNERYAMPPLFCMLFVLSFWHALKGDATFYSNIDSIITFVIDGLLIASGLIVYFIKVRPSRSDKTSKFTLKGKTSFISTALMAAGMILGGFMYTPYDWVSTLYGLGIGAMFVAVYMFFSVIYDGTEESRIFYAKSMVALLALIICELGVFYIVRFRDFGVMNNAFKGSMNLGWGISNTCGALMVMLISAAYYLVYKNVNVAFNYIMVFLAINATYFTMSRTALLIGAPLVVALSVFCFVKNKRSSAKIGCLTAAFIAAEALFLAIIMLCGKLGVITDFFTSTILSESGTVDINSRGRSELWSGYIEFFKTAPVFGAGFFNCFKSLMNPNMTMFSGMAHNTPLQFLGSCGIAGFAAYAYHRFVSIKIVVKNYTHEKFMFAAGIVALILMSLFDVYFTSPYFIIFYELYIVLCEKHNGVKANA